MTWFETEELAKYIFGLENALDDWEFNNPQMRAELVELEKVEAKIQTALQGSDGDKVFHVLADDVLSRIRNCRREIEERLMA
jgi:uncharacterized protein YlzI (FlbEa/FlbD family)